MAKSTLEEVARRVGVSARTVSRVVNHEGGFSEATRRKVQAAIDEVGYRPNLMARGLVTKRSGTVGFLADFFTDPYFPEVADAAGTALKEAGKTMYMAPHHENPAEQHRIFDSLISHGVDGIIVFPSHGHPQPILEAAGLGIPVVVLDDEIAHPRVGLVRNDIRGGAVAAVDHLLQQGHSAIGAVMNASSRRGGRTWREATFATRLQAAGLASGRITHAEPTMAGGVTAGRELLALHPDTTAVFAYNDLMAAGVLLAATEMGVSVPNDLAVVGFDDIELATAVSPTLTSVRLDREEIGRTAVHLLNRMIDEPEYSPEPILIPTVLMRREST